MEELIEKLRPSLRVHDKNGEQTFQDLEYRGIQKAFQDNVSRGIFGRFPPEERDKDTGAVNYIAMVKAHKMGLYSTTSLRICMNSSMKKPLLLGVRLDDCHHTGLPALANLYTVTLEM
jgi:hypothetical protein